MELLIRIADKGPNVDQSKDGDVIAVCPDGWAWSDAERNNPDWRIVVAPITQIEADALLAGEPVPSSQPKRRRIYAVNTSALKGAGKKVRSAAAFRALVGLKP